MSTVVDRVEWDNVLRKVDAMIDWDRAAGDLDKVRFRLGCAARQLCVL